MRLVTALAAALSLFTLTSAHAQVVDPLGVCNIDTAVAPTAADVDCVAGWYQAGRARGLDLATQIEQPLEGAAHDAIRAALDAELSAIDAGLAAVDLWLREHGQTIADLDLETPRDPVVPAVPAGALASGDFVSLQAMASRWAGHDGFLSPCGDTGACGLDVSLRPDASFQPGQNMRRWQIEREAGAGPLAYGDRVRIRATMSQFAGGEFYLSPCGQPTPCGRCVTLRPDSQFTIHEPDSNLRTWIVGGGAAGQPVMTDGVITLEAIATRWEGHSGFLSPCGGAVGGAACGTGVSLRPDAEFDRWEPGSNLRNWTIRKL